MVMMYGKMHLACLEPWLHSSLPSAPAHSCAADHPSTLPKPLTGLLGPEPRGAQLEGGLVL